MPFIHQDTIRAGGGGRPRSLVDFFGYEPPRASDPVCTPTRRGHDGDAEEWRWEPPGSPPAAHSPRALVPPGCFPPRHTQAYASYSESARPGSGWDESNGEISDLVSSLKALTGPSAQRDKAASTLMRIQYNYDNNNTDTGWQGESGQREDRHVSRRASFSGVVSPSRGLAVNGSDGVVRWSGVLPPRGADGSGSGYSRKVFLGGLPWDIGETSLMDALKPFQPTHVEWPGRDMWGSSPRGFAYVTFENERCVLALLAASRRDGPDRYYRVRGRNIRPKDVQVIPWAVSDCAWVSGGSARLEPSRTVFVGALHGMLSAHALATIMNDLFHGVIYAGIDTDKNKYPIGSGRVTFSNVHSYVRAISANYIEIRTDKFSKKVQVDPYLEDSMCSVCNLHQGPYFCRVPVCFRYFCRGCWAWQHPNDEHKPLMRVTKGHQGNLILSGAGPHTNGHGTTNGPMTNGPMSNGPMSNGPMTNGPMSNGPMTNGPMTNGPMTNGPMTNGPMTNGPMTNGPMTNGLMTNGPMSNGPMSNGPMTNGPMTNGPMSNGPMSNGPMSNGPMSNGPMSNGPMSNGPMSNGPMSNGPMSNGMSNGPTGNGLNMTNGPLTNGFTNGRFSNGQMTNGPMTNGPMTNGPMTNGPMTNGPMTNGPMTNGPMTNGPMTNGPMTNGPMTNGPMTNGPMTNGPMTNGPMSNGPMSNGPMSNGPMTNGPMTNGPMTNGPMTNGGNLGYQSSASDQFSIYSGSGSESPNAFSDGSGSVIAGGSMAELESQDWH